MRLKEMPTRPARSTTLIDVSVDRRLAEDTGLSLALRREDVGSEGIALSGHPRRSPSRRLYNARSVRCVIEAIYSGGAAKGSS
jgi:hypothetical protein